MKVIIDLIEDIRTTLETHDDFTVAVMALSEDEQGNYIPVWKSGVSHYELNEQEQKIYFYLAKEQTIPAEKLSKEMNELTNQEVMYEINIVFSKDNERVDKELIGFGEALDDKSYCLFIAES